MNLLKKMLLGIVVCFALVGTAFAAGNDVTTVGMTATVDEFAEWGDVEGVYTIAADEWTNGVEGSTISAVGMNLTVTKELTLYANANVTLSQAGDATNNSGILTKGVGVDTLTTSYQIRGDVGTPDTAYKAADAVADPLGFFAAANTYTVTHTSGVGSYAINLMVQAESDDEAADDAGPYTAGLTITATW